MPSRFAGTAVQALVILEDVFPVWKIREAFAAGTLPGKGLETESLAAVARQLPQTLLRPQARGSQ